MSRSPISGMILQRGVEHRLLGIGMVHQHEPEHGDEHEQQRGTVRDPSRRSGRPGRRAVVAELLDDGDRDSQRVADALLETVDRRTGLSGSNPFFSGSLVSSVGGGGGGGSGSNRGMRPRGRRWAGRRRDAARATPQPAGDDAHADRGRQPPSPQLRHQCRPRRRTKLAVDGRRAVSEIGSAANHEYRQRRTLSPSRRSRCRLRRFDLPRLRRRQRRTRCPAWRGASGARPRLPRPRREPLQLRAGCQPGAHSHREQEEA